MDNKLRVVLLTATLLVMWGIGTAGADEFPRPQLEFDPEVYYAPYTDGYVVVDGLLDDPAWQRAPWTEAFRDIEGELKPPPRHFTAAKMLWGPEYLYIAVVMEEPDLQASFLEHDSYIYQQDNDIEVFIDPDGDTHNYFELELNALNTAWDLLLTRPYRDGGAALHGWDIKGLESAVQLGGTLNDASDVDAGWSVEIAIPWSALSEAAGAACPPSVGDYWRLNFSRVEWRFAWEDGHYVKEINPETGEHYPENNWVWSPQGLIAMHYPERWGYVVFTEAGEGLTDEDSVLWREAVRAILYDLYYLERDYQAEHGEFALFLADLNWNEQRYATAELRPLLLSDGLTYRASVELPEGGLMWIDHTGRSWFEPAVETPDELE